MPLSYADFESKVRQNQITYQYLLELAAVSPVKQSKLNTTIDVFRYDV